MGVVVVQTYFVEAAERGKSRRPDSRLPTVQQALFLGKSICHSPSPSPLPVSSKHICSTSPRLSSSATHRITTLPQMHHDAVPLKLKITQYAGYHTSHGLHAVEFRTTPNRAALPLDCAARLRNRDGRKQRLSDAASHRASRPSRSWSAARKAADLAVIGESGGSTYAAAAYLASGTSAHVLQTVAINSPSMYGFEEGAHGCVAWPHRRNGVPRRLESSGMALINKVGFPVHAVSREVQRLSSSLLRQDGTSVLRFCHWTGHLGSCGCHSTIHDHLFCR